MPWGSVCTGTPYAVGGCRVAGTTSWRRPVDTWLAGRMEGQAPAYADLDAHDQVEVLRRVALRAAEGFGVGVRELSLVLHAYNTTFRLDTDGGRTLALRVGTNSRSTPANVVAQQAWQRAISHGTDVLVPDPVRTPGGAWFVAEPCAALGREVLVTAASWLDGDDVGDGTPTTARALGGVMASLHRQAATWVLPPDGSLPVFDAPLFGDEDLLTGAAASLPGASEVVAEAMARSAACFAEVGAGAAAIPLHGDLHGGNLKWHEERLAVFDFDDSGMGVPLLDLAIATFYLRRGDEDAEAALRAGYAEVAPLPAGVDSHLEPLVAARQLLLANSLLDSSTTALREQAADYVPTTVHRLRHWLATGRFVLDPPPAP